MVEVQFDGLRDDPAPADLVVEYGQRQDAVIATALAQILPVLLLTLPVLLLTLTLKLRRTSIHRRSLVHLIGLALFFVVFDVNDTVKVLPIDGMLYPTQRNPTQRSDLLSALTIFGLLVAIFRLSFVDPPRADQSGRGTS